MYLTPRAMKLGLVWALGGLGVSTAAVPRDAVCHAVAYDDGRPLSLLQRARAAAPTRAPHRSQRVRGSLFFLHIMKCAGTSFSRVLDKLTAAWNRSDVGTSPIHLVHRTPHLVHDSAAPLAIPTCERDEECPDKNEVTFVLEEVVGKHLDTFRENCDMDEVTFLRYPINRTLSQYQYYYEQSKLRADEFSPEDLARRISYDTCGDVPTMCTRSVFLFCEKCLVWQGDCGVFINHQTLALAGQRPLNESFEHRLQVAIKYLDRMPFFGIAEYYRESVCLFLDLWFPDDTLHFDACCQGSEALDECTLLDSYNVEGDRQKLSATSEHHDYQSKFLSVRQTARAVLEGNRYDCFLYTHALRRFQARVEDLQRRRGVVLGLVRMPPDGEDICDQQMALWL